MSYVLLDIYVKSSNKSFLILLKFLSLPACKFKFEIIRSSIIPQDFNYMFLIYLLY